MLSPSQLELGDVRASAVALVDPSGNQISSMGDPSRPANAALTSVTSSATSVTLLAANANRRHVIIVNNSTKILYIAFAATASLATYTVSIAALGVYIGTPDGYTGVISGIWAAVNGSAKITEVTT